MLVIKNDVNISLFFTQYSALSLQVFMGTGREYRRVGTIWYFTYQAKRIKAIHPKPYPTR